MEEVLQTQLEQITTIFDSINAVVYVSDLATNEILYLNHHGMLLFGDGWRGKLCHEVIHPGQNRACTFCTNARLLSDGEPQPPCIWEYLDAKAGRWFQCIDRAIRWTDGRYVRMEIAFDITERKMMEQLKDEMIAAVSHEMRTPLTAMLGYTEYLMENKVDEAVQKEFIRIIHNETERLNELIGNFLDLQCFQDRHESLSRSMVPLRPLIEEAVTLFARMSRDHRLIVECPPDLPPVLGDAVQLHQVLNNLISNAVKYSPEGGEIVIGARGGVDGITIFVRDEGIGVPPEQQEQIFDKFYRVNNTDRRPVGGAGLGLALVREITQAHGGKVWVESIPERGSTFHVFLPAG